MNKTCAALLSLAILTGCATMRSDMQEMKLGMTPDQVMDLLGKPDGVSGQAGGILFQYADRWVNAAYTAKADYYVLFMNGLVSAYGNGHVRQRTTDVHMVVPFPAYNPPPMPPPPPLMPRR